MRDLDPSSDVHARDSGPSRFVMDTMLGRLARWLRAMGYDTAYLGQAEDRGLLQLARAEGRVLVTRDRRLARLAAPQGCWVRSETLDEQIREIVASLGLAPEESAWLTRCLECNARLQPRAREGLSGAVPEHVFATHAEFWGCPGCGRVYWGGSHADRMLDRLARLLGRGPVAQRGCEVGAERVTSRGFRRRSSGGRAGVS